MSAIEQLHRTPSPADRRRSFRVRLDRVLTVHLGRHQGVIFDLSVDGARVRHSGTLLRGTATRVLFDWGAERFVASAEVLSSRLVMLGARDGESATYETRLRFTMMEPASRDLLARVIATVTREELRTWVDNLKGEEDEQRRASSAHAAGFIRCRYLHRRWEKKWTRESAQPLDGFVLPAGTDPKDVDALCRTWESMDADARCLLQLTAQAVVDEAVA